MTHRRGKINFCTFIKIKLDELPPPDNVKNIINILREHRAPLKIWHRLALEYRKAGHMKIFEKLVDTAAEPGKKAFLFSFDTKKSEKSLLLLLRCIEKG